MRAWTVVYVFGKERFELRECPYPGHVNDYVYLQDTEFRILSVRYFPEKGIVYVSLTKETYE